ncbi:MAG: hypothetical protein WD689_03010 [Gaiellaceae bacterium]
MPFWRRKPLHQRLAEEGGLVEREPPRAPWDQAGVHGLARPRRWDAVATARVPGLEGDQREFVLLEDGTLLGDEAEVPLAEALGLEPPFRAEAVRRDGDLWAVAATRIAVISLEDDPAGDVVDLAITEGQRTLVVDGATAFGTVPELERLLEQDGVVHAERLDGKLWEVRVAPL